MKNTILFAAMGATMMLASCSQDESLESRPARGITFNTSVGVATRANVMDLDGLKTVGFNVSSFRYSGTGTDKKVSDKVHFDNLSVGWSGNAWVNDLRYWPSSHEKTVVGGTEYETTGLEFLAYSPTALNQGAEVTYANGDMTISDFAPAAAATDQKDLSVAYAADQTEAASGASGVNLAFVHALAQGEVKARNYANDLKVDIKSVKLCNVGGKGTMTLGATSATPSWTMGETTAAEFAAHKYATADLTTTTTLAGTDTEATSFHTESNYFMLLPQTSPVWQKYSQTEDNAAGAYFLVTCKIYDQEAGNTHYRFGVGTASTWGTVAIPLVANGGSGNMKWEAGKKYIYTLEFFKVAGGGGYNPPTPEGETPTGDEGQPVTPGMVTFETELTVEDWGDGDSYEYPACLPAGTRISMTDGTTKNIEEIRLGDRVLTFDHETGKLSSEEICYVYHGGDKAKSFTLSFDGGATLGIVGCHDLLEKESLKYVRISEQNASSFIGKKFYNAATGTWVALQSITHNATPVDFYSIYSAHHLNCAANGMLTVPDDVDFNLNIYELDDNLKADADQLAADIAQYGLSDFTIYPEAAYAYTSLEKLNGKYTNIAIGKGLVTLDQIWKLFNDTDY